MVQINENGHVDQAQGVPSWADPLLRTGNQGGGNPAYEILKLDSQFKNWAPKLKLYEEEPELLACQEQLTNMVEHLDVDPEAMIEKGMSLRGAVGDERMKMFKDVLIGQRAQPQMNIFDRIGFGVNGKDQERK